jgi:hypothetical protein
MRRRHVITYLRNVSSKQLLTVIAITSVKVTLVPN